MFPPSWNSIFDKYPRNRECQISGVELFYLFHLKKAVSRQKIACRSYADHGFHLQIISRRKICRKRRIGALHRRSVGGSSCGNEDRSLRKGNAVLKNVHSVSSVVGRRKTSACGYPIFSGVRDSYARIVRAVVVKVLIVEFLGIPVYQRPCGGRNGRCGSDGHRSSISNASGSGGRLNASVRKFEPPGR